MIACCGSSPVHTLKTRITVCPSRSLATATRGKRRSCTSRLRPTRRNSSWTSSLKTNTLAGSKRQWRSHNSRLIPPTSRSSGSTARTQFLGASNCNSPDARPYSWLTLTCSCILELLDGVCVAGHHEHRDDVDRPEGLGFRGVTRVQLSATERHVDDEALEQLVASSNGNIMDQFTVQVIRLDLSPEGVDVLIEDQPDSVGE